MHSLSTPRALAYSITRSATATSAPGRDRCPSSITCTKRVRNARLRADIAAANASASIGSRREKSTSIPVIDFATACSTVTWSESSRSDGRVALRRPRAMISTSAGPGGPTSTGVPDGPELTTTAVSGPDPHIATTGARRTAGEAVAARQRSPWSPPPKDQVRDAAGTGHGLEVEPVEQLVGRGPEALPSADLDRRDSHVHRVDQIRLEELP